MNKASSMHSLSADDRRRIDTVGDLLDSRMRVLVITGAGISADSGLPTYRGTGGLYNVDDTEDGVAIEDALSATMFRTRPELTWKYISQIERSARGALYNRGHQVIAEMEQQFSSVCVLTQNIDGFHLDAGSRNVIEIHGNLRRLRCLGCAHHFAVRDFSGIDIPPFCHHCGSMMRPDVVLFEEMLPVAAQHALGCQWQTGFDIVFTVGTTSVFPYIAEPVVWASRNGVPTVEINPSDSTVSSLVDHQLRLPAVLALEEIWQRYQRGDKPRAD